jgi:hypothetical protein
MANTIDWGQAAVNNTIDYGQGAIDNTINWGKSQTLSPSGETNITGTPSTPPFSNVNSFSFDGIDDSFLVPDTSGLSFGNGTTDSPFSISFWVNLNSLSGNNNVFIGKDSGSPNREYAIGMFSNSNKVRFFIKDNGGNSQQSIDSTTNLTTSSWFHIVTTYSGIGGSNAADGMKIYINGSLETSTNIIKQSYTAMKNTSALLTIGKINSSPSQISGLIDETAIFTTELSQSDVSAIYNNGEPQSLDAYSPFVWFRMGDNATWNGATWTMTSVGTDTRIARSINMVEANRTTDVPTIPFSTKSILLDGVDDLVTMGNVLNMADDGTDSFSCSFWMKRNSFSTEFIVSKQLNGGSYNGFSIYIVQGRLNFFIGSGTSPNSKIAGRSTNYVIGSNWNNVILTYDGSQDISGFNIYINGVSDSVVTISNNTPTKVSNTTDFQLSGRGGGANLVYGGGLDEVAFWNGTELTSIQASEIGSTLPTDLSAYNPTSWWRCGDGDTAPTLTDNGSGGNDGTMTNFTTFSTDVPT